MKVLILNRRDIKNPQGGGAEVYTHEVAKSLKQSYENVTVFSSRFKGSPQEETIDGIRYIRAGNEVTVHIHGFLYALKHRKEFDLIIDEFNGVGFFCFLLPRSVILIHQLYREFWFRGLGIFGVIPYVVEPLLLRCYRRMPAVTVSDSTKEDLKRLGFKDIHIVMNALCNRPIESVAEKEPQPTLVFLGRFKATKRPEDAIKIFKLVKAKIPEARLWMIGKGPDEAKLKKLAEGTEDITFHGWLTEERKFELLRRAHILVVPSVREGFGINVIEAASQGTPAVGYNIHGLRDSIRDGLTGLLANSPEDAAEIIIRLLKDPALYNQMASQCLEYSRDFNWQKRAEEFRQVIKKIRNQ
jgi:glycosyltransferase involved in cell wall biosynthesis